jgi:hypothetical protein
MFARVEEDVGGGRRFLFHDNLSFLLGRSGLVTATKPQQHAKRCGGIGDGILFHSFQSVFSGSCFYLNKRKARTSRIDFHLDGKGNIVQLVLFCLMIMIASAQA